MSDKTTFESRFRRFSRARRGLRNAALSYRLGLLALIAGIAALLSLSGRLPWLFVNLGLFALLTLWLAGLLVAWLVRRVRFRSCLDEAFHIEELAGNLNSRVVSAWDFVQSAKLSPLQQAVIQRAEADLQERHEARLDRTARNRRGAWCAIALTMFLALGLTPWFSFAKVRDNFLNSWRGLQEVLYPVNLTIELNPRQPAYRLKSTVKLALSVNRKVPGEARVVQKIGKETKSIPVTLDENNRAAIEVTSDVEAEQVLTFEIGERKSEEVVLIFTTPPALVNMQTELVYPRYTRLPPRSLESVQQRLLALPGTRITLGFTFSKELESAWLTWEGRTEQQPLDVLGRYAAGPADQQDVEVRRATLQVRDKHGFGLDEPLEIEFVRQVDEPPRVALPRHLTDDMAFLEPQAKAFGFGVQTSDDYGVAQVVLKWQKATFDNRSLVLDKGEVQRLISPPQPRATVVFENVFADMGLKPGDRINFWVEVRDNRDPKPQTTRSRICSFYIHQENLGDLTVRELGFGGDDPLARERIARSTRATTVKEPEGLKSREMVRNEFEAKIASGTQAPTVRGEHAQATRDYFRLLSTVKYPEPEPKKP